MPPPSPQSFAPVVADDERLRRLARDFDDPHASAALAAEERRAGLRLVAIDAGHTDRWLEELLDAPTTRDLVAIDLAYNRLTARGCAAIAERGAPARLRELRLDHNPLGVDGVRALARTPTLATRLTRLALRCVQEHGPCAFADLLAQPWPVLEHLDLGENALADTALLAATRQGHFPRLRELRLDHTLITDAALAALAASAPHLPTLRRLEIGGAFLVRAPAILALLDAFGGQIEHLGLGGTRMSAAALDELTRHAAHAHLRSLDLAGNRFAPAALARLLRAPAAHALTALDLTDDPLDHDTVRALVEHGPPLTRLALAGTGLDAAGLALLGQSEPLAAHLRELDLARNPLGDDALQTLARTPFAALERLDLGFLRATASGYRALEHAPWLPSLRWLRLEGHTPDAAALVPALAEQTRVVLGVLRLDAARLVELLESSSARHLRRLTLFRWGEPPVVRDLPPHAVLSVIWEPSREGFCTLVRSRGVAHLETLAAHYAALGTPEIEALIASPHTIALRELDLGHHDGLGPEAARLLAAWPGLAGLERLALGQTNLGVDGVAVLARSSQPRALRTLELDFAGVDDAAVSALCGAPWLRGVERLSLRGPGLITDLGARVLAGCPAVAALRVLDLRGAAIGEEGVRAMLDSTWLRGLHALHLGHELQLGAATRHELLRRGLIASPRR